MAERLFLSPVEVSERYGIPLNTLAYWRNASPPIGPPFMRLSHQTVRYRISDLEAYENAQRVETAA